MPVTTDRYRRPSRRPLRIFALDPQRIDRNRNGQVTPRTTAFVPYEELRPGPIGSRIHVIDYDGVFRRYYEPVDLENPDVLIRDGLAPSETDPRFHQQMVYAVVAGLWADFETALGRRVSLGSKATLTIIPHAFYGQNAYYDPNGGALLFGYFKASDTNAGNNLPGQMVYTCLSHDIVVHEATHALIDRLRPRFMLNTNPDVAAFHEGFSDLIAIFQHFKMPEVLFDALTDARGDLARSEQMLGLARQFGYSTGMGAALRSAANPSADGSPTSAEPLYATTFEPHDRGAILVRAVFDAYLALYQQRTFDLVRIASDGTGILRDGALPADLVQRMAREASMLANQMFTALVRAFDYLPPVDVTFEDFLRALVTVDYALAPSNESMRVALIDGFRRHGIFPTSAGSLGDYAVAWNRESEVANLPVEPSALHDIVKDLDDPTFTGRPSSAPIAESVTQDLWAKWTHDLEQWARTNHAALGFRDQGKITVESRHPAIRYRANGRPTYDLVVTFTQPWTRAKTRSGLVPISGTTVVAGSDGVVRYVLKRPMTAAIASALDRRLTSLRAADPGEAYRSGDPESRLHLRMSAAHGARDTGAPPVDGSTERVRLPEAGLTADPAGPASGNDAADPTGVQVDVRMYNVGFGDCFLVLISDPAMPGQTFRILFDCGRHSGSSPTANGELTFAGVVQQMITDLGTLDGDGVKRIDIVVMTHRHRDHVHGFSLTELWADVEVGEVWMPWVEDPDNHFAVDLVDRQENLARRAWSALKAMKKAANDDATTKALDVAGEIAYNSTTNAAAMNLLHKGFKPVAGRNNVKRRFLPTIGQIPETFHGRDLPDGTPAGLKIHVLGPSRVPEVISLLDPPEEQVFPLPKRRPKTVQPDDQGKPAADDDDGDVSYQHEEVPEPFGDKWTVDAEEYEPLPPLTGPISAERQDHHDKLNDAERQRVESLAIEGSVSPLELVYRLDRSMNGTSLVIVIEVGTLRLVFPGDAQWGTWKAILEDDEARALVTNPTLYKVGHHGSHNATPKALVEDLMKAGGTESLVSVAPTNYGGGWQDIPLPSLLDELSERGQVHRSDTDTPSGEAGRSAPYVSVKLRAGRTKEVTP